MEVLDYCKSFITTFSSDILIILEVYEAYGVSARSMYVHMNCEPLQVSPPIIKFVPQVSLFWYFHCIRH